MGRPAMAVAVIDAMGPCIGWHGEQSLGWASDAIGWWTRQPLFLLTSYVIHYIIYSDGKHKEVSSVPGRQEKGGNMDDMNLGEILKEVAEENQTRKILELLNESKDLEEAREKVKSLLEK